MDETAAGSKPGPGASRWPWLLLFLLVAGLGVTIGVWLDLLGERLLTVGSSGSGTIEELIARLTVVHWAVQLVTIALLLIVVVSSRRRVALIEQRTGHAQAQLERTSEQLLAVEQRLAEASTATVTHLAAAEQNMASDRYSRAVLQATGDSRAVRRVGLLALEKFAVENEAQFAAPTYEFLVGLLKEKTQPDPVVRQALSTPEQPVPSLSRNPEVLASRVLDADAETAAAILTRNRHLFDRNTPALAADTTVNGGTGLHLLEVDLSGAWLRGLSLRGATLTAVRLTGAVLDDIDCSEAVFNNTRCNAAVISQVDFTKARFTGQNFTAASIIETIFDRATVRDTSFANAAIAEAKFRRAQVTGCDFSATACTGTTFDQAMVSGTSFRDSTFASSGTAGSAGNSFEKTTLSSVDFAATTMDGTTFAQAALGDVHFTDAKLKNVTFTATSLRQTSFKAATVADSDFSDAKFANVDLDTATLTGTTTDHFPRPTAPPVTTAAPVPAAPPVTAVPPPSATSTPPTRSPLPPSVLGPSSVTDTGRGTSPAVGQPPDTDRSTDADERPHTDQSARAKPSETGSAETDAASVASDDELVVWTAAPKPSTRPEADTTGTADNLESTSSSGT